MSLRLSANRAQGLRLHGHLQYLTRPAVAAGRLTPPPDDDVIGSFLFFNGRDSFSFSGFFFLILPESSEDRGFLR